MDVSRFRPSQNVERRPGVFVDPHEDWLRRDKPSRPSRRENPPALERKVIPVVAEPDEATRALSAPLYNDLAVLLLPDRMERLAPRYAKGGEVTGALNSVARRRDEIPMDYVEPRLPSILNGAVVPVDELRGPVPTPDRANKSDRLDRPRGFKSGGLAGVIKGEPKSTRGLLQRALGPAPQTADPSLPELQNSHGGSFVSGMVNEARDAFAHPREVYEGRADPMDVEKALAMTGVAMTGGVAGAPAGAIGSGPIRAYHGSPHDFDRFDLSKIGTGEGAQAYGHGLYFAEREGVAKAYRDALGRGKFMLDGKPHDTTGYRNLDIELFMRHGGDLDSLERAYPAHKEIIDGLRARGYKYLPNGRMYEVAIHADPERFLDWDKPLAGPARDVVAEQAKRVLADTEYGGARNAAKDALLALDRGNMTGEGAYRSLIRIASDAPERFPNLRGYTQAPSVLASDMLREAGAPGIKYLDAGSRSAGDGSRNYVVFDDSLVEILRKYGVASFAALPPAAQMAIAQGQDNDSPPVEGALSRGDDPRMRTTRPPS
jgi:hypothetical protein